MATTEIYLNFCTEAEAPTSAEDQAMYKPISHAGYVTGMRGTERPTLPGYDSGVLCIVIGMMLLVAFSFKHWSKFFKIFTQDLVSVRRRVNAFDDRTMNETRILVALIVQMCICQGILMFSSIGVHHNIGESSTFTAIGLLSVASAVYYLFQLTAYNIIGYVFSDKIGASQWVKGFNASQALLSLALLIPAMVSLFYPDASTMMIGIAITLYIASRLVFVVKSFRIFYQGVGSLLYFVIYIPAMEIVPIVAAYNICTNFVNPMM